MIIRLSFRDDKQVDWMVQSPELIFFQDVLDAIYQASEDQLIVTAFEYMDEENDRITVNNDEELHSMIKFHLRLSEHDHHSNLLLKIYPKVCKKPEKRNKHGLKVSISQPVSSVTSQISTSHHGAVKPIQSSDRYPIHHYPTNGGSHFVPEGSDSKSVRKYSASENDGTEEVYNFQMEGLSNVSFSFRETLGNGNSGVVYKALHVYSDIMMAVKSITIDLSGEEQDRIKSELVILSQCNESPHIIDFYGAYFNENRIFLCTEYMDGGSLDRYGKIPENVLKRVCYRVLAGLRYLWSKRIMHRDVKPSNMLVNSNGQVKLCDFGVSTQLVNSIARTYIGTNAYMAPERVIGCNYTIYSDIWSLGLSICEMASGHFPYPELSLKMKGSRGVVPMEVLQCIVHEAPPCLPELDYSAELIEIVNGCLKKEAKCRPSPDALFQYSFVRIQDLLEYEDFIIAEWVKRIKLA